MKKMAKRLLLFSLGLPIIVAIIILLPHYNHLVINVLVVVFSALGAAEMTVLLAPKKLTISIPEAAILGASIPAAMTLVVSFGFVDMLVPGIITTAVSWLLISRIISTGTVLENTINHLASGFTVLLYPGILMAWIIGMGNWENSSYIILTFFCMVFAGDSAAWAAGKMFGKNNRGLFPASPKKSIAGFIGGLIAPTLIGMGAVFQWPQAFMPDERFFSTLPAGCILGLLTGIAAALGDLGESTIKRSSGIKESGSIIPGRGGVLDSIDSVSFAAPIFYLFFRFLFIQ